MKNIKMHYNDINGGVIDFDGNKTIRDEHIESVSFIIDGKEYLVKEGQFFKSASRDVKIIPFENFQEALGEEVKADLLEDGTLIICGIGTKTIRIKAIGR